MDRRTYFKRMGLATGGVLVAPHLLVTCKGDPIISLAGKHTLEPFASFEEMRNAARLSKGHLTSEMKRLIESKNAKSIFKFVQDRFMTIPASGNSIYNAVYDTRWGQTGLLRSGKGTMREKSDLLFFMLQESGFNPEYYRGSFPLDNKTLNAVFCSEKLENETIKIPKKYENKWENALVENDIEATDLDILNIQEKSELLAENILSKLPQNASDKIEHIDWLKTNNKELKTTEHLEVPIIRIKTNEKNKDLNLVENKDFEKFTENKSRLRELKYGEDTKKHKKVQIILRMKNATELGYPSELVRGEWDLQDLIGKQIALQFTPSMTLKQQLLSSPDQINAFLPFLTLRDPKMTIEKRKEQSFAGVGFDMFGNTFENTKKGVRINGATLDKTEKDTSVVTQLTGKISNTHYPKVEIRLAPKDANGNIIYGLPASAFSVKDNNEQVMPILTSNFKNPRVLILMDKSGSMPFYRSELTYEENAMLINAFEKQYQEPIIEVQTYSNDLFKKINRIDAKRYDYILFVSDTGYFLNWKDVDIQDFQEKFKDVAISFHFVENYEKILFDNSVKKIFNKENQYFNWKDLKTNALTIVKKVDPNDTFPYALTYQPTQKAKDKGSVHKVEVLVTGKTTAKPINLHYELDEGIVYEDFPFPCGLTLEIKWKNGYRHKSITKTLVGFDERIHKPDNLFQLKIFNLQLKSFVFGSHFICFEGDKPTYPTLMDDLLTANLTAAPLLESDSNDLDENLKLFSDMQPLPTECLAAFSGINQPFSKDIITFENGFQSCICSEYHDVTSQQMISKIDMLETSDIRTFAATKKEAFKRTLEQTAFLAISEGHFFPTSTYSDLSEKALQLFSGSKEEQKLDLYAVLYYVKSDKFHLIYDKEKNTQSYWQINKTTGALLGMLPDGSGGGLFSEAKRVEYALKILETWENAFVKMCGGNFMVSVVQMYSLFMAEMWTVSSLVMNDVGVKQINLSERINPVLKKHAKGLLKRVFKKVRTGK